MGDWYRVIKTIKGHAYLYEQRSWREGHRVRSECRYVGRADGATDRRRAATRRKDINTTEMASAVDVQSLMTLPLFRGKGYRAETFNFPKQGFALDLIKYDESELGNVDEFRHLTAEMRRALATVPIRDITWVTKSRKAAEKYGDPDEVYDRGRSPRIIAKDGDGGFLILKDRSQTASKDVRS